MPKLYVSIFKYMHYYVFLSPSHIHRTLLIQLTSIIDGFAITAFECGRVCVCIKERHHAERLDLTNVFNSQ